MSIRWRVDSRFDGGVKPGLIAALYTFTHGSDGASGATASGGPTTGHRTGSTRPLGGDVTHNWGQARVMRNVTAMLTVVQVDRQG